MAGEVTVTVAGEALRLLPERAAFWERAGTLFVADLHWGKAATFRAAAIPVPGGSTADDLARLDRLLTRTGASRLVFLGDLWHARRGRSGRLHDTLAAWRGRHPGVSMELVRGNHDRGAGDPPAEWGILCRDEPVRDAPFVLRHHPCEDEAGYVLAGHLHPAAVLRSAARERLRLPCFWFGPRVGVLPAFGSFTGMADAEPAGYDRIYVIADSEVVPVANNTIRAPG